MVQGIELKAKYDVCYLQLGCELDVNVYLNKLSVGFIVSESDFERESVEISVKSAISVGCVFFIIWGVNASGLHDVIDEIIESGPEEWLNVITTYHEQECLEDVLDFLLTGAMPGNDDFRCILISERPNDELLHLISKH